MKVALLKKNCEKKLRYIVSWKFWKTIDHLSRCVQHWDDRCVPVLVCQVSMARRKQGLNWRFPPNSFALHQKKQQNQVPKRDWICLYPQKALLYTRKNNKIKFQRAIESVCTPKKLCFTPEKTTKSSSKERLNLSVRPKSFALHQKKQQNQVPKWDWICLYPQKALLYTRKKQQIHPESKDKTKTFLAHLSSPP